tara:strand:- start:1631 stop:3037 length:1407 start_codon:yes stop_codon:yes gene_type:complete
MNLVSKTKINKILSYKFIILIFISFLLSNYSSFNYLKKYDNYSVYKDGIHPMIKTAITNHYDEANNFVTNLRNKNNLSSKNNLSDEFLPGRLLAGYYFLTGEDLYQGDLIKAENGKFLYLFLKSLLYYLVVYLFYRKTIKIFSKRAVFFTTFLLCLSPDIVQYHSSFWNESLFFSFQLMMLILLIEFKKNFLNNFLLGFVCGSLYLIGQEYFFYVTVIIFYYIFIFFKYKKFFIKPLVSFLIGYILLLISVSYINQKNTEIYSTGLSGLKTALYIYIVPQVLSLEKNDNLKLIKKELKNQDILWAEKNNLKILNKDSFILQFNKDDFNATNDYQNHIFFKSIKIIFKNYKALSSLFVKKSLHLITLNPFYIQYFYEYDGKSEFLKTDEHKKNIPIRIIYTLIFYFIILKGFIKSFGQMKTELIFVLTISILYVFFVMGLLGTPRYFTPALIFMSPFFGNFFLKKIIKS